MLIPHTRMALPPNWLVLFISFNVDTPYKDGSASYMVGFV